MRLKTHVGKPVVTGTFYVYDDEALAKKHIDPTIFARLERAKAKMAEKGDVTATTTEKAPAEKAEEKEEATK